MKNVYFFLLILMVFISTAVWAANATEIAKLSFTLPQTNLTVKDIPIHNAAAAKAHIRAELERMLALMKNDFIDIAVESYDFTYQNADENTHYHPPEQSPEGDEGFMPRSGGWITACQTGIYDDHGEWTGNCKFPCWDCEIVFVLPAKLPR